MTEQWALYVRQSDKYASDSVSLEMQEAELRAYAAEHGLSVSEDRVYIERHTGIELFERPEFMQLLSVVQRREIDGVLLWKTSRFSREPMHLSYLMVVARHAGVKTKFTAEDFDDETDEGMLIRQIMGYAAKREWVNIRDFTYRGKRLKVEKGHLMFGRRPLYGYRHVWGPTEGGVQKRVAYEPDPVTAPVVQRIFAGISSGTKLLAMAKALNDDGIPTSTGRSIRHPERVPIWLGATIAQLVKNPAYKGEAEGWRWDATGKHERTRKRATKLRPESERVKFSADVIPALVDAAVWDRVQRRLDENRRDATRRNRDPLETLLRAGFVVCGHCGDRMTVAHTRSRGRRIALYQCNRAARIKGMCRRHTIAALPLDHTAWSAVVDKLSNPAFLDEYLASLDSEANGSREIDSLGMAIAGLDGEVRNLAAAIAQAQNDTARAALTVRLDQVADQQAGLRAEQDRIRSRYADVAASRAYVEGIKREGAAQRWAASAIYLSYDERREAMTALDLRVRVWRKGEGPIGSDGQPMRWQISLDPGGIVSTTTTCSLHNTHGFLVTISDVEIRA